MSEIIYESIEKVFTGNKDFTSYKKEAIIRGVVKGVDCDDAKEGLETLEDKVVQGLYMDILGMVGKPSKLQTALKPGSSYQPFTITLAIY